MKVLGVIALLCACEAKLVLHNNGRSSQTPEETKTRNYLATHLKGEFEMRKDGRLVAQSGLTLGSLIRTCADCDCLTMERMLSWLPNEFELNVCSF